VEQPQTPRLPRRASRRDGGNVSSKLVFSSIQLCTLSGWGRKITASATDLICSRLAALLLAAVAFAVKRERDKHRGRARPGLSSRRAPEDGLCRCRAPPPRPAMMRTTFRAVRRRISAWNNCSSGGRVRVRDRRRVAGPRNNFCFEMDFGRSRMRPQRRGPSGVDGGKTRPANSSVIQGVSGARLAPSATEILCRVWARLQEFASGVSNLVFIFIYVHANAGRINIGTAKKSIPP